MEFHHLSFQSSCSLYHGLSPPTVEITDQLLKSSMIIQIRDHSPTFCPPRSSSNNRWSVLSCWTRAHWSLHQTCPRSRIRYICVSSHIPGRRTSLNGGQTSSQRSLCVTATDPSLVPQLCFHGQALMYVVLTHAYTQAHLFTHTHRHTHPFGELAFTFKHIFDKALDNVLGVHLTGHFLNKLSTDKTHLEFCS